jgi:hypothetical protein
MKVPDTKENLKKCICASCPSYNECMKKGPEGLYCARGRSECELKREGCICPQCPIAGEYQLFGGYYCDVSDWMEEDVTKAVKALAGTFFVPLKVAADVASDIGESLFTAAPKPKKIASTIIDTRISTLRTINKVIEKEIDLLNKYKEELKVTEESKEKPKTT